jgi:glutamyl-tRNA synthetase
MKERITFADEIWSKGQFFFFRPTEYDEKVVRKRWKGEAPVMLQKYRDEILKCDVLNSETALSTLKSVVEANDFPIGKVLPILRLSTTGSGAGPDLMGILEVLGKEEVAARIELALEKIQTA